MILPDDLFAVLLMCLSGIDGEFDTRVIRRFCAHFRLSPKIVVKRLEAEAHRLHSDTLH
jgi:hypothetical protein